MSPTPTRRKRPLTPAWLALALVVGFGPGFRVSAQKVTLHLKDGDRISGWVVSEDAKQVVVSNAWVKSLAVPLSNISKRENQSAAPAKTPAAPSAKSKPPPARELAAKQGAKPASKPAAKPAKPKGKFHGNARIGMDAIFNTKDQQSYFGDLKVTYERPYQSNPKKFFRNTAEVHGQYQRTDGQVSANRVNGSDKSDFDVWERYYAYALVGGGYDDVRKIDSQYQVGPGIGGHLFQKSDFVLNVESGLHYEAQYRRQTDNLETIYLRLGADSTWKIRKNLKLTANLAFYPDIENEGQYHNEFTSNLSYGFWANLSLNLTLRDDYNTEVAPGVQRNRLELRSSLGITF